MLARSPLGCQAARLMGAELTDRERAMLDFEGSWWKVATAKDQLIRERFHTSPQNYHDILELLIERPEAFAYHPFVVQRVRRERRNTATSTRERRMRNEVGK